MPNLLINLTAEEEKYGDFLLALQEGENLNREAVLARLELLKSLTDEQIARIKDHSNKYLIISTLLSLNAFEKKFLEHPVWPKALPKSSEQHVLTPERFEIILHHPNLDKVFDDASSKLPHEYEISYFAKDASIYEDYKKNFDGYISYRLEWRHLEIDVRSGLRSLRELPHLKENFAEYIALIFRFSDKFMFSPFIELIGGSDIALQLWKTMSLQEKEDIFANFDPRDALVHVCIKKLEPLNAEKVIMYAYPNMKEDVKQWITENFSNELSQATEAGLESCERMFTFLSEHATDIELKYDSRCIRNTIALFKGENPPEFTDNDVLLAQLERKKTAKELFGNYVTTFEKRVNNLTNILNEIKAMLSSYVVQGNEIIAVQDDEIIEAEEKKLAYINSVLKTLLLEPTIDEIKGFLIFINRLPEHEKLIKESYEQLMMILREELQNKFNKMAVRNPFIQRVNDVEMPHSLIFKGIKDEIQQFNTKIANIREKLTEDNRESAEIEILAELDKTLLGLNEKLNAISNKKNQYKHTPLFNQTLQQIKEIFTEISQMAQYKEESDSAEILLERLEGVIFQFKKIKDALIKFEIRTRYGLFDESMDVNNKIKQLCEIQWAKENLQHFERTVAENFNASKEILAQLEAVVKSDQEIITADAAANKEDLKESAFEKKPSTYSMGALVAQQTAASTGNKTNLTEEIEETKLEKKL